MIYVDTINSRVMTCLKKVVTTLAQCENSVAVQKAANHYSLQMIPWVRFPPDILQEPLDVHVAYEREAIIVIVEHSLRMRKKLVMYLDINSF